MLSFQNKGLIDLTAITTFGVSVKEREDAIGFFGTGLKYAIAVAGRLGGRVTLYHGLQRIAFEPSNIAVRGKDFASLVMVRDHGERRELPFTLELGKLWEAWQAFREFYCNGLDEPEFTHAQTLLRPKAGYTTFTIDNCPKLEEAYRDRAKFILEGEPLISLKGASVFPARLPGIYYRGVLVAESPNQSSRYAYNVLDGLTLTEDRTLKERWTAYSILGKAFQQCTDSTVCQRVVDAANEDDSIERNFGWNSWNDSSPEFIQAAKVAHRRLGDWMQEGLKSILEDAAPELFKPKELRVGAFEQRMIDRGKAFLKAIGHELEHPVVVVESLGEGILGEAKDDTIYLSRVCLDKGTKIIAGTMLEEHLHLTQGFDDCTRAFQAYLLDRYITVAERHIFGEPL